ncbi:MAG: hypothetical protein QM750_10965 [Rubrivivax sp.]
MRPDAQLAVALAMFGFSLYGVLATFGAAALALLLWALGYAGSVAFGGRLFPTRGLSFACSLAPKAAAAYHPPGGLRPGRRGPSGDGA